MFPPTTSDFKTYFTRDFNFGSDMTTVMDVDISKAIAEGQINFNSGLFGENAESIFYYLAAYVLVVNLQNSAKGISSQAKFPISSNSVGSVSVTFQVPERYSKDAFIQQYTKNGYGMKYLELVLPYLVGVASAAYRETSYR